MLNDFANAIPCPKHFNVVGESSSRGLISGIFDEADAVAGRDGPQRRGGRIDDRVPGASPEFTDHRLDLRDRVLDRIEVRGVGRQEAELRAGRLNDLANRVEVVRTEVVENNQPVVDFFSAFEMGGRSRWAGARYSWQTPSKTRPFIVPSVTMAVSTPSQVIAATNVELCPWPQSCATTVMRDKLSRVGLCLPRKVADVIESNLPAEVTLDEFLKQYLAMRSIVTEATRTVWGHVIRNLNSCFGAKRLLGEFTKGDGVRFREYLAKQSLASSTQRKRMGFAAQFFTQANDDGLIAVNPFANVDMDRRADESRQKYVSVDDINRIMERCPDWSWRLLIALARYGGLRHPSETTPLTWNDIDWERGTFRVQSPKTARYGKGSREVPIFESLRPYLVEAFEQADDGAVYVLPEHFREGANNQRTTFQKVVKRAGLDPIPKMFINFRSSAATDLADRFPGHVANAWMGHCEAIARKHYRQVTADHVKAAIGSTESGRCGALQNAVQYDAESGGTAPDNAALPKEKPRETAISRGKRSVFMEDRGIVRPHAGPCRKLLT